MPLFASDYDKSRYLRAEDIKLDTKFRIKAVTEEVLEKDGLGHAENFAPVLLRHAGGDGKVVEVKITAVESGVLVGGPE